MSKVIQCSWAAQDSDRRYQNLFRENKHKTKTVTKKVYAFFSMPLPKCGIRSGHPNPLLCIYIYQHIIAGKKAPDL